MLVSISLLGCGGGSSGNSSSPPAPGGPVLTIASGNGQSGNIGEVLPVPVVVSLSASNGTAIANGALIFAVEDGTTKTVQTDNSGQASFDWQLGDSYNQVLDVSYTGPSNQIVSILLTATAHYQYRTPSSDPEWPAAHANTVGVNAQSLAEMIDAIRRRDFLRIHSVLLARNGQLVLEESFPLLGETSYTHSDSELHYVASASKSMTAMLVGMAIDQGLIGSVDDSLYSYFPEYSSFANWTDEKNSLTIRDALMMRSGLNCADDGSWEATQDFVKTTLDLPLVSEAWIQKSTAEEATETGLGGGLYAYQWWVLVLNHNGSEHRVPFAAGDGGQMIFVLQKHNAVAVFTGGIYGTELTAQPIDILKQFVIPALN